MKYLSLCIVLLVLASSCKEAPKKIEGYYIEGVASGVYNGIRAYLKPPSVNQRNQRAIDTAMVIEEAFVFEGKSIEPGLYNITIDNIPGTLEVVLDNEPITVTINKNNIASSEIKGSSTTDLYQEYVKGMQSKFEVMKTLSVERRQAASEKNTTKVDSLNKAIEIERISIDDYAYDFIKSNADSFVALLLLDQKSKSRDIDYEKFKTAFETVDQRLKATNLGKIVEATVNRLKAENEKNKALQVGSKAPEFSAPNPEGQLVALKDVLSKVTIIDFWAAWCGPCRKENPNVVKLYEKYHNKGLQIIGVSLDRKGQKNRWLKAIEDDKLTWPQVSNLNYFNDPVAKLYNIRAIPSTFILDENGNIIAKNLRGAALEKKIEDLLGS